MEIYQQNNENVFSRNLGGSSVSSKPFQIGSSKGNVNHGNGKSTPFVRKGKGLGSGSQRRALGDISNNGNRRQALGNISNQKSNSSREHSNIIKKQTPLPYKNLNKSFIVPQQSSSRIKSKPKVIINEEYEVDICTRRNDYPADPQYDGDVNVDKILRGLLNTRTEKPNYDDFVAPIDKVKEASSTPEFDYFSEGEERVDPADLLVDVDAPDFDDDELDFDISDIEF